MSICVLRLVSKRFKSMNRLLIVIALIEFIVVET
jgi:hypothetical protein